MSFLTGIKGNKKGQSEIKIFEKGGKSASFHPLII
jgi:hypothetical protein